MRRIVLAIALLLPASASAQITMYRPGPYGGGTLYQFGPHGNSVTTTVPAPYGGFNQYHYGPGRAPTFVQPLPTPNYYAPSYAPRYYGGYRPFYAPPPMYYQPRSWGWNYRIEARMNGW